MKYLNEGSYQEAVTAFQKAIALDDNQQSVYIGAGDAYLGLAQSEDEGLDIVKCYDTAEQNYQKALEFDDSTEEIYTKLADVYLLSGDTDKAQEILDTGMEKVRNSDGKLDEKIQQLKSFPNIAEYQAQGYVLEKLKLIPGVTERVGIWALKEGTDEDCLLAEIDINGAVYASYEYTGAPKSGIWFFDEQTIFYPTETGYILRSIETGEDVTENYIKAGERIINISALNEEVCIVTQEKLSNDGNRLSFYDKKGNCLFSCTDKDLEAKTVGTSMEGIKCNWDFEQMYKYEKVMENADTLCSIWYCDSEELSRDGVDNALYAGHVLVFPDVQEAYIVPSEVTRKIEGSNHRWIETRIANTENEIYLIDPCATNGEIILWDNHIYDKERHDFDMDRDYIQGVKEDSFMYFVNSNVIEVEKRGEDDKQYYWVDNDQIQLLDESESNKWDEPVYYDGIAIKWIDDSTVMLIDENGNQIEGTELVHARYLENYFSINQRWLLEADGDQEVLLDRVGNVIETTSMPDGLDEDKILAEYDEKDKRGMKGVPKGVFVEEPGHIYKVYICQNKIWTAQIW